MSDAIRFDIERDTRIGLPEAVFCEGKSDDGIGLPEAVFCEGKSDDALMTLLTRFASDDEKPILFTRLTHDRFDALPAKNRFSLRALPMTALTRYPLTCALSMTTTPSLAPLGITRARSALWERSRWYRQAPPTAL